MRSLSAAIGTVLVLGAAGGFAAAQEDKAPEPPPPVWSGKGEVSYLATSGNSDTSSLGVGAEVDCLPGLWTGKAVFSFLQSETDGQTTARSLAFLLRGGRKLTQRLDVFVQGDYLRNTFAGIQNRYTGEGGVGYRVAAADSHLLRVEGGLGYVREGRIGGGDRNFAAARAALLYRWKLSKNAEFSEEAGFTEDLKESKDWRFTNAAGVSAALTSIFLLKVSHTLLYLHEPVPGKKRTDTITAAALVAKF